MFCSSAAEMKQRLTGATAVALARNGAQRALLLLGAPGVGKSATALELISRGAKLAGDDVVRLRRDSNTVWIEPPESDIIEARGVGLIRAPIAQAAPISLAVRLSNDFPAERPEHEMRLPPVKSYKVLGVALPFVETKVSFTLVAALHCLLHGAVLIDPDVESDMASRDGNG